MSGYQLLEKTDQVIAIIPQAPDGAKRSRPQYVAVIQAGPNQEIRQLHGGLTSGGSVGAVAAAIETFARVRGLDKVSGRRAMAQYASGLHVERPADTDRRPWFVSQITTGSRPEA